MYIYVCVDDVLEVMLNLIKIDSWDVLRCGFIMFRECISYVIGLEDEKGWCGWKIKFMWYSYKCCFLMVFEENFVEYWCIYCYM